MSTAIAIGSKTLQLPDDGESYSLPLMNQNNQNIADEVNAANTRYANKRLAEFVRANQNDEPAGGLWGPGANVFALLDATNSFNYSDWLSAGTSNDQLKFQPGVYFIDWKIVNISGGNVALWHTICTDGSSAATANATSIGRSVTTSVPNNDPFFTWGHINVNTAMDINFKFISSIANAAISQRIKITKLA
jgi:hypothetical protein